MATFAGQKILIVEDEVMIAEYLAHELRENGATVLIALSHGDGLARSDEPGLSIAVVDHKLHNRTTTAICAKLNERGVPFVIYTGYGALEDGCNASAVVRKPAAAQTIINCLAELLKLPLT
jgi:DNA-binding response OmpR family regulator